MHPTSVGRSTFRSQNWRPASSFGQLSTTLGGGDHLWATQPSSGLAPGLSAGRGARGGGPPMRGGQGSGCSTTTGGCLRQCGCRGICRGHRAGSLGRPSRVWPGSPVRHPGQPHPDLVSRAFTFLLSFISPSFLVEGLAPFLITESADSHRTGGVVAAVQSDHPRGSLDDPHVL